MLKAIFYLTGGVKKIMAQQSVWCKACGKKTTLEYKISFREECPFCHADLHICLNCRFHDKGAYNECRESSAEPVKEKEKNNHCEYFEANPDIKKQDSSSEREKALKAAQSLFKNS